MTMSQNIRKYLRKLALSTLLGAGLAAPGLWPQSAAAQNAEPPRLFPQKPAAMKPLAGTQQPTAIPGKMSQAQYVDPVEKPPLYKRIFSGIRRDKMPSAPPQDPGTNYPTKRDFPDARPLQPTFNATPGGPSGSVTAGNDLLLMPPGFQPGVAVSPPPVLTPPGGNDIKSYLGVQTPADSGGLLAPPGFVAGTPAAPPALTPPAYNPGPAVKPVPASLPAITPAPVASTPMPQVSPTQTTAAQDFLAPPPMFTPSVTPLANPATVAPLTPPQIVTPSLQPAPASIAPSLNVASGQPGPLGSASAQTADATTPDLTLAPPAVSTPPAEIVPPVMAPDSLLPQPTQQPAPAEPVAEDPLANAFPDDAKPAQVATQPTAEPVAEPVGDVKQPYSGLKLEEEMFQPPIPVPASQPSAPAAESAPEIPSLVQPKAETASAPANEFPIFPPVSENKVTVERPGSVETPVQPADVNLQPAPEIPALDAPGGSVAMPQAELPAVQPKAVAQATPKVSPQSRDEKDAKMDLIRAREGRLGLKGFCAVALRDNRELLDSQEDFSALYNGKLYSFSSEPALEAFLQDPARYAPAARGNDVIHLALTGEELEGSLDHAVWYQGRLYLFNSVETMETFVAAPSSHATAE